MLITFEGIEGCGKTTQIQLLSNKLESLDIPHLTLREPGGTAASEMIRRILLTNEQPLEKETELLLFEASRCELVQKLILPSVKKTLILCDRFTDSTLAYQGYGRGVSLSLIQKLNSLVAGSLRVKRTYLLDLPVEIMAKRCRYKTKDRIEKEKLAFHNNVRKGFLALAKQSSGRVLKINAALSREKIHAIIYNDLKKLL